jgi:hypothetical protein
MQKTKVAGWKGVRLSEPSHRHVLRGPFPNSGNLTQLSKKGVDINDSFKSDPAIADRASESLNRLRWGPCQTNAGEVGIGENFGRRKKMGEADACR